MDQDWKLGHVIGVMVVCLFLNQNLCLSWCLSDEGLALLRLRERVVNDPFGALLNWKEEDGVVDPCSWNLKDLCLGGTLPPELAKLVHIKSIVLRNNSFTGIIPEGIGELKELEVLDLGYNNFSGPLPAELGNNLSLSILLVDNNEHLGSLSPEICRFQMLSESQVDEDQLSNQARDHLATKDTLLAAPRGKPCTKRLVANQSSTRFIFLSSDPPSSSPPSPSPSPCTIQLCQRQRQKGLLLQLPPSQTAPTNPSTPPSQTAPVPSATEIHHNLVAILVGSIGGTIFLIILIVGVYLLKSDKVATVKPWATGLSGQLQKAFVTGVPKLKRSELETACEDFSNVIGSSPIGTVYKGTLSSGVEIAVASVAVTSAKDWSKGLETQFRKKIDTLSKVNHKNFVNLLGFCEEEEPFTRIMVFEYAPNGTLFEHLHIKEAEHLDWNMRLRIAMGMAYCLDPYAPAEPTYSPQQPKLFIHQLPYSVENPSLEDWASDYLRGEQPLRDIVDPTLTCFQEEQLELIGEVLKSCVHPDPKKRPAMREVCTRLRAITGITPEGAYPRVSPLWWAELEIVSADAS
uniref:Protein kinase domain-containing protein n=1 Tax=Fagus sylvatica TaxID=28930 RepID=A0A2N9IXB0_FAGSY